MIPALRGDFVNLIKTFSGRGFNAALNGGDFLPVVTPEKRGFSGFLYGGRVSPNPKKRVILGKNHGGFFGDPLGRLT